MKVNQRIGSMCEQKRGVWHVIIARERCVLLQGLLQCSLMFTTGRAGLKCSLALCYLCKDRGEIQKVQGPDTVSQSQTLWERK